MQNVINVCIRSVGGSWGTCLGSGKSPAGSTEVELEKEVDRGWRWCLAYREEHARQREPNVQWVGGENAGFMCGCSMERGGRGMVGKGLSPRVGGHLKSLGFIRNKRAATEEGTCLALESSWLLLGEWTKEPRLTAEIHWGWGHGMCVWGVLAQPPCVS